MANMERPRVKANWLLLWYLVALLVGLVAAIVLASLAVATRIFGMITGTSTSSPEALLTVVAAIVLGVLPWPGLLMLATAMVKPRRTANSVTNRTVGPAVVGLVALNEEQAVTGAVRDFASAPGVGAVIVVDNSSHDRTAELATRAGARVVHEANRGYGFACQRALREGLRSGYPVVVLCEADRTFRADDLGKLTAYLKHADLVIGSRTHYALLKGDSQMNSFLTLGNVFVGKILQLRYWDWRVGGRARLTDVGCTYMAFRADALAQIAPSLEVGGNHFVPHVLMVAQEHGLRVVQIPITFWPRVGTSKGGSATWRQGLQLGLTMMWHILTYRVKRNASSSAVRTESAVAVSRGAQRALSLRSDAAVGSLRPPSP